MIELIKTEDQYREVLGRVNRLAEDDPSPESGAGRELELLAVLLQDYERRSFPLAAPSPLAAIRLRMDQLGLAPKDLVPFLGSRSKVSEVLASKRPLSLSMIRALHDGLAIPLESLVSEAMDVEPSEQIEWDRFPVREMARRGYFANEFIPSKKLSFADAREIVENFFRPVGGPVVAAGILQKTDCVRTARSTDRYALAAWAGRVRQRAEHVKLAVDFNRSKWNEETLRELRGLSRYDVGPRLALQFLSDRGIIVIIERHFPRTRLDGAAMLRGDGTPIIGLTLRHDRLDNFWFTLFHECMHVLLHLKQDSPKAIPYACFLDDLDVAPDVSPVEKDTDVAAREALVPQSEWEESAVRYVVAPATVTQLANRVGVGEAVVAGRVRYEKRNYRLLSSMIGSGQVQQLFSSVK